MAKVSKSKYAKHRKCTPAYISKLLKAKIIECDAKGKIDVEAADRAITLHSVRVENSPLPNLDPNDANTAKILAARARSEEAKASMLETENKRISGDLVSVASVRAQAIKSARVARAAFMNISSRLAALVAAESDTTKCAALIDAEVRQACQTLADGQ